MTSALRSQAWLANRCAQYRRVHSRSQAFLYPLEAREEVKSDDRLARYRTKTIEQVRVELTAIFAMADCSNIKSMFLHLFSYTCPI